MQHLNSLCITSILGLAMALQGCTLDKKPIESPFQENMPDTGRVLMQNRLESLKAYKKEIEAMDEGNDRHFSTDTAFEVNRSGEKTHMLVLLNDENQTPHHLFVWKFGTSNSLSEELDCRFKEGQLLMAKHNNQECYFEKGRMQFWLDEKGQPLPIIDTEEWLDQSSRLIRMTGNYLSIFEK